ncbi:hypothetical protein NM688_g4300 [Phlebia brevispora]|uniref:Uncharacterized protein n=1 Tax=Phlebia brevispora TaxID=194682 RepID=A0ACC1T3A7_9APHY|nr:hypothetical protein NM688_g4300 [Phlebia brevispora]
MQGLNTYGESIPDQVEPTVKAFTPLLKAREQEIFSVKRKTFKYGATDRHQLDVYYPPSTAVRKAPILFFVYGGGYTHGDRVRGLPDYRCLNTGAFFAKQGFSTVIADYRVYPHINFPDPATDIADAYEWIVSNMVKVNEGADVKLDASQVFFMGHSAGSTSISTLMLVPGLLPVSLREHISGLILMSGAYDFRGEPMADPKLLAEYFGATPEEQQKTEPLGLLENAPNDVLDNFPPVLAPLSEYDSPPIVVSHQNFISLLRKRVAAPVEEMILKGHNHISPEIAGFGLFHLGHPSTTSAYDIGPHYGTSRYFPLTMLVQAEFTTVTLNERLGHLMGIQAHFNHCNVSQMEVVKGLGSNIPEQMEPTNNAFEPLLRPHEAEILSYKRRTFKYGATDRHQLDVYYPFSTQTGTAPVLFFVYGGGYVTGSRLLDPPHDLKYKNVGAFFAKRGFVVVIADYRLLPHIKYPDPAIDIRDAVAWVVANNDVVNQDVDVKADVSQIFLMGHSAGATTVSTLILLPDLLSNDLRQRISGVIFNAGAYEFRGAPALLPKMLRGYYGTDEELRKREPLGLLENAPIDMLDNFPPVLVVIAEFDFPPLVVSYEKMAMMLKAKLTSGVDELLMKGHNHVSPYNSLFSGEGEEWGLDVVEWLKAKCH